VLWTRLPEKLRLVLLLAAMEGHTLEEVATMLGLPIGTVSRGCLQVAEISGEAAMLCEKYKEALVEAAASGATLPNALREHVQACEHCAAVLTGERALFAASMLDYTKPRTQSTFFLSF